MIRSAFAFGINTITRPIHANLSSAAVRASPCAGASCDSGYSSLSSASTAGVTSESSTRRRHFHTPSARSKNNNNASHGGILVGAVCIDAKYVPDFKKKLRSALRQLNDDKNNSNNDSRDDGNIGTVGSQEGSSKRKKQRQDKLRLAFRGVEKAIGPSRQKGGGGRDPLIVHLPTAAAAAFDDGNVELLNALKEYDGVYLPGVRRSRYHPNATRKRRNAQIPTYVRPRPKQRNSSYPSEPTFTFAELFAGIGGFRLGLEPLGGRCVFANEIDPYACAQYRRHFDSRFLTPHDCPMMEADIIDICASEIPSDIDIVTAGFPCQPFSARGEQDGLQDERGQLYRELVRVLRHSRPKSFIFENVLGLVTMGKGGGGRYRGPGLAKARGEAGSVFKHILGAFDGEGYDVTWNICDGRHYVPQRRERVYIVGTRKDIEFEHDFSWDWYDEKLARSFSSAGYDANLDVGASLVVRDILEPKDSHAVRESELSPAQWSKVKELYTRKNGELLAWECARIDIHSKAPTLISSYRRATSYTSKFIFEEADGTKREVPRFLTARECCRIMGFPEDFDAPMQGSAVAHHYQGVGNAVIPPLVQDIGKELTSVLGIKLASDQDMKPSDGIGKTM